MVDVWPVAQRNEMLRAPCTLISGEAGNVKITGRNAKKTNPDIWTRKGGIGRGRGHWKGNEEGKMMVVVLYGEYHNSRPLYKKEYRSLFL